MEEKAERALFKAIYTKLATILVGLFVTSCVGLTVFYFNTQHVTAQNTKDIIEEKADIKEIKKDVALIKTVPTLNKKDIQSMKKDIDRIEKGQVRIQADMKEMLKVLYEIKRNGIN